MSLRAWWTRLGGSLRRGDALERDMDQEMRFHLDMAMRRNVERGMTASDAARQAKLTFGSAEAFREDARDAHRARLAESLIADIRYAVRGLRQSPSFAVAAILTLAIGIGSSTAMFTVTNALLLRPMPVPRPDDVTYLGWVWRKGNEIPSLTAFQYEFVRDHSRAFEALATYGTAELQLGDGPASQPLGGLRVSGDFFGVIGIPPRLGRAFDARELQTDAPVVILGDSVWRARFGADSGILGRQVHVDGESRTVVGILPPEFRFPPAPLNTAFLVPLLVRANPADEGHNSDVIGRFRDGTPPAARAADVQALTDAFRAAHPALAPEGERFKLFTHTEANVAGTVRHTLWVLLGAVTLVLLIACANTATLLVARAWGRQREIAVRASIGAGRTRILRQLVTEGLVLSGVAAAIGVLLSIVAVRVFVALSPSVLPAGIDIGIDARVLGYAIAASAVTGVLFGLATGMPAVRTGLHSALLAGARGASTGGTRVREALVFFQTAVAVILLAGATLLAASFARLIRVDPGFEADRVIAVKLGRLPPDYDPARRSALVDRLLERTRALPGVERVAAAPNPPLERGMNFPVDVPERPERAIGLVELRHVSPDYLATLGIPVRGGRDFDARDASATEPVAIVNEAFARHFWDGMPGTGRAIRIGHMRNRWIVGPAARRETRVIGVAADIHEIGLDRPARPTVLIPLPHDSGRTPILLVRGAAPVLIDALRNAVLAEEPRLVPTVEPLSSVVSRSIAAPRFRTLLVGSFAVFALLLAGIGIYGVIASVIQQRHREIGIRLALGATRASVSAAVVRRCLVNVAAGAGVGLVGFLAARQVLGSWLYGVSPGDPRVLAAAIAILAAVALLASWIPARRAARIDPVVALRLE
ncbi:MAG: ABC transporter permease [Vicinamibacterales bacterium]